MVGDYLNCIVVYNYKVIIILNYNTILPVSVYHKYMVDYYSDQL